MMDSKPVFECPRCGYVTNKMSNYKNHLAKKRICAPVKSTNDLDEEVKKVFHQKEHQYRCEKCGKGFISLLGKTKHVDCCVDGNVKAPRVLRELHPDSCEPELKPLEFCKENIKYVDAPFVFQCLEKASDAVIHMAIHVYMNPQHPENHNVWIANASNNKALVFRHGTWESHEARDLCYLITRNCIIFMSATLEKSNIPLDERLDLYSRYGIITPHKYAYIKRNILQKLLTFQSTIGRASREVSL